MASKITKIVANFETQLGSTLAVSAVTGYLKTPVVDDDGVTLPDGKYVMTVDLGNTKEEHILFDLIGSTGVISNIKSVSRQGVETIGCVRQHRSGAKVTLTNFANLLYVSNVLMGLTPLDGANPLLYDIAPTLSNALQLATKGYVDGIISGSVGTASESLNGTTRISKNQGSKQKARSVWIREQDTPDKTLKVESIKLASGDRILSYSGGNTPNFIDPAFGGDMAFALNPVNGETITITVDGVATVVTFVTTIGVTAGNILIGGTVAVTRANFVNFINNPSVTNANQVAVTGTNLTAIQKLSATDDLTTNAFIRVINPTTTTFSVTETLAGAGNIWTVNTTKNRIDLVVLDQVNTLQIRKGVEAVSPSIPLPTTGDVVICSVLNRVGQTTVRDYNVSGQAYVTDYYDLSVYGPAVPTGVINPFAGSSAPLGWLICDGSAVSRTTYASLFSILGITYGSGDGSTTFNLPDLRSRIVLGVGTGTKVATFTSRSGNVVTVSGLTNANNNEFQTGQIVRYSTSGSAIGGLTNNTDYYVVRSTNTTFSLATTLANAQNGVVITLSSDGTGIQTFTQTLTTRTLGDTGGEENHAMSLSELVAHSHGGSSTNSGITPTGWNGGSKAEYASPVSTGGNQAMNVMQPFLALNYIIKF